MAFTHLQSKSFGLEFCYGSRVLETRDVTFYKSFKALSLFEKEEIVPNTVLYTKMISGLCEASLFEEAMDFLHRMRTSSCIPNVLTYRTLLCG